jgi:hypothetical protein
MSPASLPPIAAAPADVAARTVMPDAVPERPQPVYQPQPSSAPTSAQIARRRRVALFGAGAVLLTGAVVGGVVLAGGGGSELPKVTGAPLQNADLALTVPKSWSERPVPDIPGLHPRKAIAAEPGSAGYVAAELVTGRTDPTLLPPKLRSALKERQPKAETITVDGLRAYRYTALRPRGLEESLRVYVLLTTGGVATVACNTSPAASADDCDGIAGTLKLKSAKALPIGPTEAYGATLKKTFATVETGIAAAALKLIDASGAPAAEASVWRRARRLYQGAIAELRGGRLNPLDAGLNAKVTSAFKALASAYGQLARAARRKDAAAEDRAQRALNRADARIDAANAALERVGYAPAVPETPETIKLQARAPAPAPKPAPKLAPTPTPTPKSTPTPKPTPPPPPPPPVVPPPPPPPPPPADGGGGGGGGG